MVRIIIKGGKRVWKNTEDEVLKAAIAKYGKNQWARISSLLVRKTPKQCKARWYEWLDPSIKKTEWSKAEDEKLLHLAKLMPTQWRTIAPIVGRTATQCLERYQKLLDEAEQKENEELGLAGPGGEAGPSAEDIRRLRPGEIDPDPETKPARPDPIDMDEDEKEMLSEARARLANTQGKKAKRKARERQLEEARRLAVLQKKRELKAAGIVSRFKVKRKGMDYNADIPFEHRPALGFYDTSEEQAKSNSAPVGQTLRRLENKRKPEEEEAERKKRQKKLEEGKKGTQHETKFLPARDAQIQKLKEAEQISRRRKLVLPQAQVGEKELEEIVKIGMGGRDARAIVEEGGINEMTGGLLGEYDGLKDARMARTPRTGPQEDMVLAEARNLRTLTATQTPLLGEENTPLHLPEGTGFQGVTPRAQVPFTPNPLATPRTSGNDMTGSTPLRLPDNLGINTPMTGGTSFDQTPVRNAKMAAQAEKQALANAFRSLPQPENRFEIMLPEEEGEDGDEAVPGVVEDAAERDKRLKREEEERKAREFNRRSLPVQRGYPRPANVDVNSLRSRLSRVSLMDENLSEAQAMINDELARLAAHDAIAFPLPGTANTGSTVSHYVPPEDHFVANAKTMIEQEVATALGYPHASKEKVREGLMLLAKDQEPEEEESEAFSSWAALRDSLSYDPSMRTWTETASMGDSQIIAGLSHQLTTARDTMAKEAARAAKVERKLGLVLGGYQTRADGLRKKLEEGFSTIISLESDLQSFEELKVVESAAGPRRLEGLVAEVGRLERREGAQQGRYKELLEERDRLVSNIARLEEKMQEQMEEMNVDA
ncbi:Pre-mRNA-splicing factor CEF1 [Serendipita indica DSM 11827]|nr:Pre-mRNA-splicing factor CEF1 [Serendipita indica DSM 11827]